MSIRYKNQYKFKTRDGVNFVQIFHHNCRNNEFFTTSSAKLCFKTNTFSVISLIDDDFRFGSNSSFEFLLEYPELTEEGCSLYHWYQTTSLLSEVQSTGYHHLEGPTFSGLSLSTDLSHTLIDGSPGEPGHWWFSLGEKRVFGDEVKGIPGPVCQGNYIVVKELSLWIRFDNASSLNKLYSYPPQCSIKKKKNIDNEFILSVLFVTLVESE